LQGVIVGGDGAKSVLANSRTLLKKHESPLGPTALAWAEKASQSKWGMVVLHDAKLTFTRGRFQGVVGLGDVDSDAGAHDGDFRQVP
jgi:hypothetical protein